MISYTRRCKINGFHILRSEGVGAEIQYSFRILINDEWVQESITEWFDNEGDAPHIGEVIEVEVQEFEGDGGEYYTLERIGW